MELDKRITNGRKPFDCVDAGISETVKSFIGKKGYFANHISEFTDISDLEEDVLTFINPDEPDCEVYTASCETWEYFLPSEWVKEPEKRYRPYTLNEFVNQYSLGDEVIVRLKGKEIISHKLFVEYDENDDTDMVRLSFIWYGLVELYDSFEIYTGEGWKPFGVEE